MQETSIGLAVLFLIMSYFIILAIKIILIGLGKVKDIHEKKYIKSNKMVIKGVIVLIVTIPFFCYLLEILIRILCTIR